MEGKPYLRRLLELEERFGPARERGGSTEEHHYDLARSLQVVLEETALARQRSTAFPR